MMKSKIVALLLAGAFALFPGRGRATEVVEGVISTQISNRQPVDIVHSYGAAIGKLYCFTHLVDAPADSEIFHVWYRGNQEMARIKLPVRSSEWRIWSEKSLMPDWKGEWRVEVIDAQGRRLKTIPFTLL